MYHPLIPCPGCQRHVMQREANCPFCAAPLDPADLAARVAPDTNRRMTRAAAFVFGATVAMGACSGSAEVDPSSASSSSSSVSSSASTSSGDQGGFGPLYGAAGGIGGTDEEGGFGGNAALYGSAPVGSGGAGGSGGDASGGDMGSGGDADGGVGGGGVQPLYGAPGV